MARPTPKLGARIEAGELAETETELEALRNVREITGGADGPLERHGVRTFLIGERLAWARGERLDREVLLVTALLHDIGLYEEASEGGVYVTDGRNFASSMLVGSGWSDERIELCLDAIERHHELRSQWGAGTEVELMRRADLVDVAAGRIRFGLGRGPIEEIFAAVPRAGFYREIGRLVGRSLKERPATVPQIFIRGRG